MVSPVLYLRERDDLRVLDVLRAANCDGIGRVDLARTDSFAKTGMPHGA